jgi:hypothetical protein
MIREMKYGWTAMTLLGLLAGAASADEGGVVKVSDSPPPASGSAPAGPSDAVPATTSGANVVVGADCQGGDGTIGRARLGSCLEAILAYNPARGFRPPTSVGVDRDAVIYYRYWPARWYGDPNYRLAPSFPMVYMPTDTTQLGVYYARVPQWLPNPGMYPRPPRPDEWNRRVSLVDHAGGGCYSGGVTAEMAPASGPTPDVVGTPSPSPGGGLQPIPQQSMPPAPRPALPPAPQGN